MTNEELAKRIYSGENDLMTELWKQTRRFIYGFCKKSYTQNSERFRACGVELEDLISEAYFALTAAVKVYNEKQGEYKFLTYLKYPLQKICVVAMGCQTVTDRKSVTFNHQSLDAPHTENKEGDFATLGDVLIDDNANVEEDTTTKIALSEVFPTVKKILANKPKNYNVLKMHYMDNVSLGDIGKVYGYSRERIRQLKISAFRHIRKSNNKKLLSLRDEIIGMSYSRSGFARFANTHESSVEWAVLKMEKTKQNKNIWSDEVDTTNNGSLVKEIMQP